MKIFPLSFFVLPFFTLFFCPLEDPPPDGDTQRISFPPPKTRGRATLEECIQARRSIRSYQEKKLTMEELGQLSWAAQGITERSGMLRAAPSAGALYPLEIYLVSSEGLFHYLPKNHQLERLTSKDLRNALCEASLRQQCIREAPVTLVIAAVFHRTARKYGEKRSWRYIDIEVGHAAQNVDLQAVALNLGTVNVGAFHDKEVRECLNLPEDHEPRLLIPIGHPKR